MLQKTNNTNNVNMFEHLLSAPAVGRAFLAALDSPVKDDFSSLHFTAEEEKLRD